MSIRSKLYQYKFFRKLSFKEQCNYLFWKSKKNDLKVKDLDLGVPIFSDFNSLTFKNETLLKQLKAKYLKHDFDILGSGWMSVYIGMPVKGFYGAHYKLESDLSEVDRVAAKVRIPKQRKAKADYWLSQISDNYALMEWHRDLRSGYQWPLDKKLSYSSPKHVEIKSPWELARCHHLPQLAMCYSLDKDTKIGTEYINQVYDFMFQNPYGLGVNWMCAMDVAIRACNWVMTYDLLEDSGFTFKESFKADFSQILLMHAKFILNNLEWTYIARSNHYLANLVGLITVFSRLESSPETDRYLNFCYHELSKEHSAQFFEDGTSYEGSSSYHRLSAEIIAHSYLIFNKLTPERKSKIESYGGDRIKVPSFSRLPKQINWSLDKEQSLRLSGATHFLKKITLNQDQILQIGDSDSGRLFKIIPAYDESLIENHLSSHEVLWVHKLLKNYHEHIVYCPEEVLNENALEAFQVTLEKAKLSNVATYSWDVPDLRGLELSSFDSFGLYIFKTENFVLTFKCGGVGQGGVGGHDHNDQLSVNLSLGGRDLILDPGTFVYTSYPEMRNNYRSIKSHFAPQVLGKEPAGIEKGLFRLESPQAAELIHLSKNELLGMHKYLGETLYRRIELKDSKLIITDYSKKSPLVKLALRGGCFKPIKFSPGYGVIK